MSSVHFKWSNNELCEPIRLCISDNLSPLLPHSHKEIELMYLYETTGGIYRCGKENITFDAKTLLIVNPFEVHSCETWGNNCVAACLLIKPDMLSVNIPHETHFRNKISNHEINIYFDTLKEILSNADSNSFETECKVHAIIYNILSVLFQHTTLPVGNGYSKIADTLDYINEHISETMTLQMLADRIYLSKDRFSHLFKETTGYSPIEYIIRKRINVACKLLLNSDMTIQEIASACNFCTAAYFSKTFAKHMNLTPGEYRKKNFMHI